MEGEVGSYGPGAYLFGGEKGLEEALDAFERGINWLELFTAGKIALTNR